MGGSIKTIVKYNRIIPYLFLGWVNCFFPQSQSRNPKTEVLILASYHLNQIKDFEPKMLDSLIDALNTYEFDVIGIENMPAELLYDIQSRKDSAFNEVLTHYGGNRLKIAQQVQQSEEISFLEAKRQINPLLATTPLLSLERKKLITNFLASADLASAVLQYQYLLGNSLDTLDLGHIDLKVLDDYSRSSNEIVSLAIPLALHRDLQKLEYIDDFQDEALLFKYFPTFIDDYRNHEDMFKEVTQHPVFQRTHKLVEEGVRNKNLLPLFEFLNSTEFQKLDVEAQWEIWLKTNFTSGSDRARYALWEMRNLQIASKIMKLAALYPEKRILIIIGASHKSFLEKYLNEVPLIQLIQLE